MPRAIAIVVHPGFQLLDTAGPTAAFEIATRMRPGSYTVALLAPGAARSKAPRASGCPPARCAMASSIP